MPSPKTLPISICVILLCLLLSSPGSAQTTWIVDQGGGGDFTTIQSCLDNASDGDTCQVNSGTYLENPSSWGKRVNLLTTSGAVIDGNNNGTVLNLSHNGTSSAMLSGFTIQNGSGRGINCNGFWTISGCTIRNNGSIGIYAGGPTTITGNMISGNSGAAILLDAQVSDSAVTGNTISGNGLDCIAVDTADILSPITWSSHNVPYYVLSGVGVGSNGTLTIDPGVVVKFNTDESLQVDGTLVAVGTASQPIYFTSIKDDSVGGDTNGDGNATSPARGDWGNLYFTSTSTASILDGVVVRYGGGSWGALRISTSALTVSDSLIEESLGAGIYIENHSPTISECTIRNNTSRGIRASSSSALIQNNTISDNGIQGINAVDTGNMTIIGNTITGHPGAAILLSSHSSGSSISGNTISGNGLDCIAVDNADILSPITWSSHNVPYYVPNGVFVDSNGTLTIDPGVVVKFNTDEYLQVDGTLIAVGTPSQPIYFTSIKDDSVGGDMNGDGNATSPARGDWGNLYFTSTSTASILDGVVVRYGGGSWGALRISTSALTVSDSLIEESGSAGMYVASASPTILGNIITGNPTYGLYNSNTSVVVIAEDNYWGHPSGPYDPSDDTATGGLYNPTGQGDRVSDYVDYDPWLTEEPVLFPDLDTDGDGCVDMIDDDPANASMDADQDGFGADCDCDEDDQHINPGVFESFTSGNCVDGEDNDCDGLIDSDPECVDPGGGSCTGTAEASAYRTSPVYGGWDAMRHLSSVMIPIAVIVLMGCMRRRK